MKLEKALCAIECVVVNNTKLGKDIAGLEGMVAA